MIETSSHISIELTIEELYLLAGLLRIDLLLGVPDPFPGYLTEEIEEIWMRNKEDLIHRGILVENDREIEMDGTVATLVGVAGLATKAYHFQIKGESIQEEGYFHVMEELTVHKRMLDGEKPSCYLEVIENFNEEIERKLGYFAVAEEEKDFGRMHLPKGIFDLIFTGKVDAENWKEHLNEMDLTPTVEQWVTSMKNITLTGQFTAMTYLNEEWMIEGFGWIQTSDRLWMVVPQEKEGKEWVEVRSLRSQEAKEQLLRLCSLA